MTSVCLVSPQTLFLVLEVLAFYLDSRQNAFHLGKMTSENLFENALWLLDKSFATFNISLLPWPQCKSTLLNLPSPLDHELHQIQQVEPPHMIIFHLNLIQTNFCLLFQPLVIYKGTPLSVLIFAPKPFSLPSPLNPQPRSMKIHWSSVQIFQTTLAASLDQICQIW